MDYAGSAATNLHVVIGMSEKQSIKSNKGGKREGAGRPAGVPNKLSGLVKDNIATVFEDMGGVYQMTEWAKENPNQFYAIYAKLLPLQVNADVTANTFSRIEVCIVDPEV